MKQDPPRHSLSIVPDIKKITPEEEQFIESLNVEFHNLKIFIKDGVPKNAERLVTLKQLEETRMWALRAVMKGKTQDV